MNICNCERTIWPVSSSSVHAPDPSIPSPSSGTDHTLTLTTPEISCCYEHTAFLQRHKQHMLSPTWRSGLSSASPSSARLLRNCRFLEEEDTEFVEGKEIWKIPIS